MKKNPGKTAAEDNVWDDVTPEEVHEVAEQIAGPITKPQQPKSTSNAEYDIDGLMTDFPTAKELAF